MSLALGIVLSLVLATIVGIGSAAWVIFRPPVMPVIRNGSWITNLQVGSAAANIYVRAHIALTGLFALNKKETIYYRATVDDEGERLRADRDYVVTGADIPARWWGIMLYGQDNHLIANAADRYSFNMGNLEREPDGTFRIHLSRQPQAKNWLPAGARDQRLSFSLKVYNPAPEVYRDPAAVALPRISRVVPP